MSKYRELISGWRALLILVALTAIVRIANAWFMADSPLFLSPTSDAFEHYRLASNLAAGDWLGRNIGPYHRPQLFAYVIAGLFRIFGTNFLLVHAFLITVDSLGILAWYALARCCFPKAPAFLGCVFIALHWTFVYFSASGYMETFAIALNGIMLAMLSIHATRLVYTGRGHAGKSPWTPLIVAGIFGGLGALTRPTILLVMPGFGFALLWLHWKVHGLKMKAFFGPALFAILVTITLSPNAIRHWTMYRLWAPLGTGSELNFHMGNRIDGWGWDVSSPGIEFRVYQNLPVIEGGVVPSGSQRETFNAYRNYWASKNKAYIQDHFGDFAKGYFQKVLQLCNYFEIYCTQDFLHSRQKSPILRILPGLLIFAPFGFAGILMLVAGMLRLNLVSKPTTAQAWSRILLLLWIVPYLLGVALYLSIARHRLPIIPPFLLLGGWAAWTMIVYIRMKSWNGLAPWMIFAVTGILIVTLPVVDTKYFTKHERWWTQVNLGTASMALGRREEAAAELRKATEIYPEKMESWFQLSRAEEALGELEPAILAQKELLMRLRTQYPNHYMVEAEIFDRLASLQLKAGKLDDAEQTARKLAKLVPDSPVALVPLAKALAEKGNKSEAIDVYKQILTLDPNFPGATESIRELQAP